MNMRLVLLGAPGAGKGTQAAKIAKKYNIPAISTGDIFRENVKNETELGKEAKKYMDAGELVPDELVNRLVIDRLQKDDCKDGYLFDGYPRTIPQAEAFEAALKEIGQAIDYAIDVEVPDEAIMERMSGRRVCPKCGASHHVKFNPPKEEGKCDNCGADLIQRDDDKPEIVSNRLNVYHESTQPIIDFYRERNVLAEVDGTQDVEKVFEDIAAILG